MFFFESMVTGMVTKMDGKSILEIAITTSENLLCNVWDFGTFSFGVETERTEEYETILERHWV